MAPSPLFDFLIWPLQSQTERMTTDYRDLAVTCHPAAALSSVAFYCLSGLARPQVLTVDPAGICFSIYQENGSRVDSTLE